MNMSATLPRVGKLDPAAFDSIIFPQLGAPSKALITGPRHGVDAAILDLGDRVMAIAEDPTFGVASWGWKKFGWGVVHICAGDVAVTGIKPQFMTISLLLPPATPRIVLEEIWSAIHEECAKLGIAIVGGHTGSYGGIPYPLNGGCTVWGFGKHDAYVTPAEAKPGDLIILTKGAAIEAAGVLALQYPKRLARVYGNAFVMRAQETYWQMSIIEDARTAFAVGGVTSMHDATEGGILGGLFEVAHASRCGLHADLNKVRLTEEASLICRYFDMDPFAAISEGTLVITAQPNRAHDIVSALSDKGIHADIVGEMLPLEKGRFVTDLHGKSQELAFPEEDPFWAAFFKTLEDPDA